MVENVACLRLTNRGMRDSFRVKVSNVAGTDARELDYESQWIDFPDVRELTLDRDESALLRIAALNVMDTSVDADRWLELGVSGRHLLRLFKRGGHVDREVPNDVDVRLKVSVYRGRSDAAPIGSNYRIAIVSNAVWLRRDDATQAIKSG